MTNTAFLCTGWEAEANFHTEMKRIHADRFLGNTTEREYTVLVVRTMAWAWADNELVWRLVLPPSFHTEEHRILGHVEEQWQSGSYIAVLAL